MQCLTWAFSKPHGSQQESFSSTALWSRSRLQQLPPPCQAPLGAAGGAGLCSQITPPCSAMGSSAKGASVGLRQQRLDMAARLARQVDVTSHPNSSIATFPSSPRLLSPLDPSLQVFPGKQRNHLWFLGRCCIHPAPSRRGASLAMPRCPGPPAMPRAHVQAWHESSIGSLWRDPRSNSPHVRGQIRASHKKGKPGCIAHPWGPARLRTAALSPQSTLQSSYLTPLIKTLHAVIN